MTTFRWAILGWLFTVMTLAAYAETSQVRAVGCTKQGTCRVLESDSLDTLGKHIDYVWLWSATDAPRRFLRAELKKPRSRYVSHRPETVRLIATTDVRCKHAGLTALYGPVAMWLEVPERLMPRVPCVADRFELPRTRATPWRVRLVGESVSSWWVDVAGSQNKVRISTFPAVRRVLNVRDEDGAAISTATLTLMLPGGIERHSRVLAHFDADARGRISVEIPPEHAVGAILGEPSYLPRFLVGPAGQWRQVEILHRGSLVSGRVIDAKGAPIAGVSVTLESWLADSSDSVYRRDAVSDASGSWTVKPAPSGKAAVRFEKEGLVTVSKMIEVDGKTMKLSTVTMSPARSLTVRVVDENGHPVQGATVGSANIERVKSDARGVAVVPGAPFGQEVTLDVASPGYLSDEVTIEQGRNDVTAVLRRAAFISGRVVDDRFRPVDGAMLLIIHDNEDRTEKTGESGAFRVDVRPGRELTVEVSAADEMTTRVHIPALVGGQEYRLDDLVVRTGHTVRGRLISSLDGKPIRNARIWVPRVTKGGAIVAWARGDVCSASSDDRGEFALSGLSAGRYLLRVDGDGFARLHRPIEIVRNVAVLDLGTLFLEEGGTVVLHTSDEGATARLDLRGEWKDFDMLTAPVRDGEAVFRHVATGTYPISVVDGSSFLCTTEVTVAQAVSTTNVTCKTQGPKIAGQVTVGGVPASGGGLTWLMKGDRPQGAIFNRQSPLGVRNQRVVGLGRPRVNVEVDSAGAFQTSRLLPGAWTVTYVSSTGTVYPSRGVDIPDADEYSVTIELPGRSVRGIVRDAEDAPVSGAVVREIGAGAAAMTHPDGTFELDGLQGEVVAIQATYQGRFSKVVTVKLDREPQNVELVVRDEPSAGLVRVWNAAGGPAPGALVFIQTSNGDLEMVSADSSGSAKIDLYGQTVSAVRAASFDDGLWCFSTWHPIRDDPVEIDLRQADGATLVVTSPKFAGLFDLETESGWDLGALENLLGAPLRVTPDRPLSIMGLPPGSYQWRAGSRGGTTTVEQTGGRLSLE